MRDFVGYGRRPPRVVWPDGARVAVSLVLNYEEGAEQYERLGDPHTDALGELPWSYEGARRDFALEGMYEYGSRSGIWRLFGILHEYDVKATVFACGAALERNSAVGAAIAQLGHETCGHGYRFTRSEDFTTPEEEREEIERAIEAIRASTGVRPVGWYWRYSPTIWTRSLLVAEGGFIYDSDSYNDDLPYYTVVSGKRHLVVPYTLTYNDVRFVLAEGSLSPDAFCRTLRRGLDELLLEGERGYPKMMTVGLHPRWAGQASRANAIREFIECAMSAGDVWFARRDEIARWWTEHSDEWGP